MRGGAGGMRGGAGGMRAGAGSMRAGAGGMGADVGSMRAARVLCMVAHWLGLAMPWLLLGMFQGALVPGLSAEHGPRLSTPSVHAAAGRPTRVRKLLYSWYFGLTCWCGLLLEHRWVLGPGFSGRGC